MALTKNAIEIRLCKKQANKVKLSGEQFATIRKNRNRKPYITNFLMATKITLTYLLLMNSFSFWQLENAKGKKKNLKR